MSQAHSISTHRRFGTSRVCRIWGASRATVYRRRGPAAGIRAANAGRSPKRRGPQGACSDAELLRHIQAVIAASPFSGEGYRKVWARLRAQGVRTAPRRVRRVMKENDLLAPQRPVQQDAHPHNGTIVTDKVDEVWGTDMTQTVTTGEGRAYVFIAVDHCSGEFIGTHASSSASRWEALEPVRQGITQHFGGVGPDVAKGLTLRHDHGSNYMADDFQNEIKCFGIVSSPAFVRQPEGNGVAERAIRTLKEQLLWVQHFETVEDLRQALASFAAEYNASWLRQRHGYKTPDQIRVEQKALEPEAATGVKMAA
jgi:transposase InsO family protein